MRAVAIVAVWLAALAFSLSVYAAIAWLIVSHVAGR